MNRSLSFIFALGVILTGCAAAQNTTPPLIVPTLPNQFYVGYEQSQTDYGLQTPSGIARAVANGINLQYGYRQIDHVSLIGTLRHSFGGVLGESLTTAGMGAGYVLFRNRYEPFIQAMLGYSRLSSGHEMYLASRPMNGFTTLFGAGLDISLNNRWGLRPLNVEYQYLPFGAARSVYWNVGGGVLFHCGHPFR